MKNEVEAILNYDKQLGANTRALTGAFYTPLAIASDMIAEAVHYYLLNCGYQRAAILDLMAGRARLEQATALLKTLRRAKFIDMACGTGVFGFAYLLKLAEWQRHYDCAAVKGLLSEAMANMVLNDRNADSVAQFSTLVAQHFDCAFGGQLLHCDALTELAEVSALKTVLQSGGFDIIVGNPPYIGERGHGELFEPLKNHPKWSAYYRGKMDYSYFFVHQALDWVSKNGVITQIMTSYFTTADGAVLLRNDIKARATWRAIHYYDNLSAFKDVPNLSFIIMTLTAKRDDLVDCKIDRNGRQFSVDNASIYSATGSIQLIPEPIARRLTKLAETAWRLSDVLAINQGLVSGADRFKRQHSALLGRPFRAEQPIFVFEKSEWQPDRDLKLFVKNSDITRYRLKAMPQRRVLYSAAGRIADSVKWLAHLAPYRVLLERRREVKNGRRPWYELQWPRAEQIFLGQKIIVPQRAPTNRFAYVAEPLYGSADVYFLSLKDNLFAWNLAESVILKGLTVYLNSALVGQWLAYKGKRKGVQLELYATPLRQIPLPAFSTEQIAQLAAYYDDYVATGQSAISERAEQLIKTLIL